MIGWVGLIVPHIARMISGPDYTKMLPCSVLTGAIFLLIMDDLSRCLFAQEIPLGVLTANRSSVLPVSAFQRKKELYVKSC